MCWKLPEKLPIGFGDAFCPSITYLFIYLFFGIDQVFQVTGPEIPGFVSRSPKFMDVRIRGLVQPLAEQEAELTVGTPICLPA
jgi:hypothetical protein